MIFFVKDSDFMQVQEFLVSVPLSETVANFSLEMESTNINSHLVSSTAQKFHGAPLIHTITPFYTQNATQKKMSYKL